VVTSRWSAADVLPRARVLPTAREIAETLIAGKALRATRKQFKDLQALWKYGLIVVGQRSPARWQLKRAAN
jgi:hypothetical protein